MAKKFAKKVIALTAVTAMLCASCISASAATYTSTTTYYNGVDKIQVTTNVSGLEANDEVTYLAYAGEGNFDPATSEIVYVNQYTVSAEETSAKTFSYVTDSAKVGSSIMMAKADANFENGAAIAPAQDELGEIDGAAVTFNVSVDGVALEPVQVEAAKGYATVSIPVTLIGKEVTSVVIDNEIAATNVIVVENTIKLDMDVTKTVHNIAVTTKFTDVEIAAPTFVAGAKDFNKKVTVGDEEITGTVYTVIADATYTPVAYEVGVAFADENVFAENVKYDEAIYYASIGNARGSDGKYAIVIVDKEETEGKVYYATYMKDAAGNYTYGSTGSIDLTAPQA